MSSAAIFTGLELLIQLIDRTAAASAIIKKAHAEGRPANSAELKELRDHLDGSLASLDDAIARAEAEGR
jgi:hypothetical protein